MSKRLEQYFYLVLGSTLLTLGIWLFVTPNQINFGGMIGLAQLIDYFIHKFLVLPKSLNTLGMINLLMNKLLIQKVKKNIKNTKEARLVTL